MDGERDVASFQNSIYFMHYMQRAHNNINNSNYYYYY